MKEVLDNKLIVDLADEKKLVIKVGQFDDEIDLDIDTILQIDYMHLVEEIATFPVILNRLGILLAQFEEMVNEADLDLRVFKAKERKRIRDKYIEKKQKAVIDVVDDDLHSLPMYKVKNMQLNKLMKERDYMNSIFWSAKQKADNLNKLSLTIQPGDIDVSVLVKEFNGILIQSFKQRVR